MMVIIVDAPRILIRSFSQTRESFSIALRMIQKPLSVCKIGHLTSVLLHKELKWWVAHPIYQLSSTIRNKFFPFLRCDNKRLCHHCGKWRMEELIAVLDFLEHFDYPFEIFNWGFTILNCQSYFFHFRSDVKTESFLRRVFPSLTC